MKKGIAYGEKWWNHYQCKNALMYKNDSETYKTCSIHKYYRLNISMFLNRKMDVKWAPPKIELQNLI